MTDSLECVQTNKKHLNYLICTHRWLLTNNIIMYMVTCVASIPFVINCISLLLLPTSCKIMNDIADAHRKIQGISAIIRTNILYSIQT